MRQNLPVTQQEYQIQDGATLMSTTDIHGNITYANAAFLQVSGFTAEELIGQPHNLVRHPDMPQQAFADMWDTLKQGRSWSALVKNRRKNGDHYWVRANATPVVREGQVIGYMSVRTKAASHEIKEAERLYADFREGRASHLRFFRGIVIRNTYFSWMSLKTLTLRQRIWWPSIVLPVLVMCAAYYAGVQTSDLLVFGGLLAGMVGLLLALVERQLIVPLKLIQAQAQMVAAGGQSGNVIDNRIDAVGLVARSVNQAGLNMKSLVDDVVEQIAGVQTVADAISCGNHDLNNRTELSTANLQSSSRTMDKMAQSLHQSAGAASKAASLSRTATAAAEDGEKAIKRVVDTMAGIASASHRIRDIISVIDGIAFQTNILALNASVEAARAGEQGRGFAVVAQEVRNLAQRSATAAKEISSLLMENVHQVDKGNAMVVQSGEVMHRIMEQVGSVSKLIEEISVAVGEQASGMEEVNAAMREIECMTQQNTVLTEQSSVAADGLKIRSAKLAEATDVFRDAGRQPMLLDR